MSDMAKQVQPARSSREQFDRQAPHYDAQWNTWSQETLDWLIGRADIKKTDRVLDVATGGGFTALAFAPHAESVIAIDVSPGMLEQARGRAQAAGIANVSFQEAGAESLPFDDGSFDIVTCRIAAHHFLNVGSFVEEAARVLRSGGRLLIADTTVPDDSPVAAAWQNTVEVIRDPSHVKNYSPAEWRALIETTVVRLDEMSTEGAGITIPLNDWIHKAGCTPDQAGSVREQFETAPPSARSAFAISRLDAEDEIVFTWQRVLIKASKPG